METQPQKQLKTKNTSGIGWLGTTKSAKTTSTLLLSSRALPNGGCPFKTPLKTHQKSGARSKNKHAARFLRPPFRGVWIDPRGSPVYPRTPPSGAGPAKPASLHRSGQHPRCPSAGAVGFCTGGFNWLMTGTGLPIFPHKTSPPPRDTSFMSQKGDVYNHQKRKYRDPCRTLK